MDNIISAIIAGAVFTAFVLGLAESIGEPPFIAIVVIVVILMSIDVVQTIRSDMAKKDGKGEEK